MRQPPEADSQKKRTDDTWARHTRSTDEFLSQVCSSSQRTTHLHTTCQRQRRVFLNTKVAFGKQFIVDDEQKVVYCQVPNIGSHSVKSAIIKANLNKIKPQELAFKKPVMGNWEHGLEDYGLTHMVKLMPMYKTYSKFLIVRHPMDRILSAYNNLRNSVFKYKKSTVHYFLNRFSLQSMKNLTLQQFSEVITEPESSPSYIYSNPHWKSVAEICFPCHIKYNSILRLETFEQDSSFLHKLKISPAELPHLNQNPNGQKSLKYGVKHLHHFSKVSVEQLAKLQHRYQMDMDLFGYGYDDISQITSCSISSKANGTPCC